jgi:hypothetical protein
MVGSIARLPLAHLDATLGSVHGNGKNAFFTSLSTLVHLRLYDISRDIRVYRADPCAEYVE